MAESKQKQKDRERLAQLRADTSEVWNSPRVVKVSEPAALPAGSEGAAVVSSQREPRKTGWWLALHRVREFGFTSPDEGHYLLLPPEFDAILHKHFEFICGSSSQAHTGLKKALNEGYILRRPCHGGFEYSVKWREFQHGTSTLEVPLK